MASDLNHTQEWVAAGLITDEQASSIDAFEATQSKTRSAVLEVLGYVGAALVLIAGLIIVGDMWPDLDRLVKVTIAASAAAVLIGGGLVATGSEGDSLRRVGQISLLLAAGPLALAVGVLAEVNTPDEVAGFLGFAVALLYCIVTFIRDTSWAQHLGVFITGVGTATLGVTAVNRDWTWEAGAAAFVFGVLWLGLSTAGRLPPRLLGEIAGLSAMMFGSIMLIAGLEFDEDGARHVVLSMFIAVAFSLVAVGTIRDRVAIIVGGMIGLLVYIPWLISSAFGETLGAPVVLLIVGGLLIGSAVYLTRRMRTD
jgi:hypothetical protein